MVAHDPERGAGEPDSNLVDSLGETVASADPGASGPAFDKTTLADSGTLPEPSGSATFEPFGPFSKIEPLSEQGAMGVVARGYHRAFDRWELLKFLRPELSQDPEILRQFFREGRVLAKLSHPNVVRVFALYSQGSRPCLAMEFLEGRSLGSHFAARKESPTIAEWRELFLAAARGLAAAHEVGLLHRDIKPENLFVADARPGAPGGLKLIDFGLATAYERKGGEDPALVARMSGGTPLFMAPELWRGKVASPRSDVYALGLTFYTLLAGKLPFAETASFAEVSLAVCSDTPFPDAREARPDLPGSLAELLARAMAKPAAERFATADELVTALVAAPLADRRRRVPGSGPYRGLARYGPSERDVFFGRDTEIAEVLERLRLQAGVVLAGPSGSGKSSLARAGILPAVEDGALGGGVAYRSVALEPGIHPLHSLASALAQTLACHEREVALLLESRPETLGDALRAALPPGAGLIVLVDQLEEVATLATESTLARAFAVAIASLADVSSTQIRVVATVRVDLMDRLFATEPLRPLLTRGFYPVRPLAGEALLRAVVEPARAAGYALEDPHVADAAVREVAESPGALPLLSFAMAAWWEARDEARRILPTAAWVKLGGVAGALVRHADQTLDAMSDEVRRAAEPMLLRLVSAERTRASVQRSSLLDPAVAAAGTERALERLLEAKLVQEGSGKVQLAHDALVTSWPRLAKLLVSSGVDRAFHEQVSAAATQWDAQGRPRGALWTDDQAERLLVWFARTSAPLDQLELAFVDAVRSRWSRRRWGLRVLGLTGGLAVLVATLFATVETRRSEELLATTRTKLEKTQAAYKRAESGRLRALARQNEETDPPLAIEYAAASYELVHDPSLDRFAWAERARGYAAPLLDLHAPARMVRVEPRLHWIAVATDSRVSILDATGPGRRDTAPCDAATHQLVWRGDKVDCVPRAGEEFTGPHGETLTRSADGSIVLHAGRLDRSLPAGAPPFAWIPARNALAFVGPSHDVRILSLETGETLADVATASHGITALDADAAGEWLFAGTSDGLLLGIDLDQACFALTHGPLRPAGTDWAPSACALAPDGTSVGCADDGTVTVRRVARSASAAHPPVPIHLAAKGAPLLLALAPQLATLFAMSANGVSKGDGAPVTLPLAPAVAAASERFLAMAGREPSGSSAVVLAPSDLGSVQPAITWPAPVTALGWEPHGDRLIVASADRQIRVIEPGAKAFTPMFAVNVPAEDTVRAIGVDDAGGTVALGSEAGAVLVAHLMNGPARRVATVGAPVACVRFAREGAALVVAAGLDVSVIDVDSGASFVVRHTDVPVVDCARSPFADRFSFVQADGAAWLKALDLSGVTASYVPSAAGAEDNGLLGPTAEWRGVPAGL